MFLRQAPEVKVADLRDRVTPDDREMVQARPSDVTVDLDVERIRIGSERDTAVELRADEATLKHVAGWLDVPYKFLLRTPTGLQQTILTTLIEQAGDEPMNFEVSEEYGLMAVRPASVSVIDPRRYIDIAAEVVSPEADVVEWHSDADVFHLDVVVPENFDRGWGGDRQVGDLTAGGIRIGQDRKRNLAPWTQPFFYRLACTNGYETFDEGLKVDARGATPLSLLHDLEDAARRAFARVEGEIESFYSLREQRVEDPSQAVLRMAREQGLPDRTAFALVERVPEAIEDVSQASMFDVVNLVTNAANDPAVRNRLSIRRQLEQAGGMQVTEHIARCNTCQSKLN